MLWPWKILKLELWQKVLGLSIVILAALGYVLIQQSHQKQLAANPDRGATLATADLLATANLLEAFHNLQTSFDNEEPVLMSKESPGYRLDMLIVDHLL